MQTPMYELPPLLNPKVFGEPTRGLPASKPLCIRVLAYGGTELRNETLEHVEEIESFLNKAPVVWIDIEGFDLDLKTFNWLCNYFNILPVHSYQVLQLHHNPRYYHTPHYQVAVYPQYVLDTPQGITNFVIFRGSNYLLSFHNQSVTPVDQAVQFILQEKQNIQAETAEYLDYVLSRLAIQNYIDLVSHYHDHVQKIAANATLIGQPEFWQIAQSVEQLNNQLLFKVRVIDENSAYKAYWQDLAMQVTQLSKNLNYLAISVTTLQKHFLQKIQQQQTFFLKLITGLLAMIVVLLLILIII